MYKEDNCILNIIFNLTFFKQGSLDYISTRYIILKKQLRK